MKRGFALCALAAQAALLAPIGTAFAQGKSPTDDAVKVTAMRDPVTLFAALEKLVSG